MLGSEYGWTPEYCLNGLSWDEIEALLGAIKRRYKKQADAVKKAGDRAKEGDKGIEFAGKKTPRTVLAEFGIEVE